MKRLHVLLVDDDEDILESLSLTLSRQHDVEVARNGREALAAYERRSPDVLVLDLMMPVMSGHELLAELAARNSKVPVILSSSDHELRFTATRVGAAAYLRKPYGARQLAEAIDKVAPRKSPGGSAGNPPRAAAGS
jgi:DNA-binding response OmpR family regulator